MKQIKNIRQSLGFCQEDMASTLGVTRSMIVRAENGSGDLNFEGCKQLINLDTYIKESEKTEDIAIAGNNEADHLIAFKSQLQACNHKAYPIRQKLKKLETAYIMHQKSLKVLERMELHKDLFPPTLLASLKASIKEKLAKCSYLVRATLEMKIKGLEAEERYILEQIEKLKVKSEVCEPVADDGLKLKVKGEKAKEETCDGAVVCFSMVREKIQELVSFEPEPMNENGRIFRIHESAIIHHPLTINQSDMIHAP